MKGDLLTQYTGVKRVEGVDLGKESTHKEYLDARHEGTLGEAGPGHACQNF